MFKKNDTIVFFGDSITEAGKVKIESTLVSDSLGRGYVNMVNSHYLLNHPELNLRFINQGISGNRSIDLVNRVDEDVLDFNPDYTFIMVGINDVKRNFDAPQIPYMTTSLKQYQENFEFVIDKMLKSNIKIIVMTPFYLVTNNDDPMRKQVLEINKFLEEFTLNNNLPLIHLQNSFDVLMKTVSRHSISRDDIHLNMAGHMFVQQEIVKQIKTL